MFLIHMFVCVFYKKLIGPWMGDASGAPRLRIIHFSSTILRNTYKNISRIGNNINKETYEKYRKDSGLLYKFLMPKGVPPTLHHLLDHLGPARVCPKGGEAPWLLPAHLGGPGRAWHWGNTYCKRFAVCF